MTDHLPPTTTSADLAEPCAEIVITAEDQGWLAGFARSLVESRLAACVHVISEVRAIYRWDGAVHDEAQSRLAVHTRSSLVSAIVARADTEHPDLVPCVIAIPIVGGHPAYLRWIHEETIDR